MNVAAAGSTIIFISLLVLQAIVGFLVLSYAGRCFLLVVEETAAGNDEVIWSREPITDWFGKFFYLAWLAGVWLVPTWLVLRFLREPPWPDAPGLAFVVASVGAIWLLFPVSLLSSLAAGSPWAVLYPGLLWRLLRHFFAMVGLYVSSAALLAASAALAYFVLTRGRAMLLLPVVALIAAAVLLIYARLLGRVALLVNRRSAEEAEVEESEPPKTKRPGKQRSETGAEIYDPWEIPNEEPRPPKKKRGAYGIKENYQPAPEPAAEAPAGEVYGLQPAQPTGKPSLPPFPEDDPVADKIPAGRKALAEELEKREPPPPLPSWPLLSGVYTFPWYGTSVTAWLLLAFGLLLMGIVLGLQIRFSPF
jgi:hypothetical protein